MSPNPTAVTYHLLVSASIAYMVSRDSLSREGKLPHWGYLLSCLFNLWAFSLPFYYAKRRLFDGEVRRGGYYWNVCRSFTLLWTLLFFVLFFWSFISQSWRIDSLSGMEFFAIVAASGVIYTIWVAGVSVAAVVGFVLREPDVIENGSGGPVAPASVPESSPSRGASSAPAEVVVSVTRAGVSQGSFSEAQLRAALVAGTILPSDYYWTPGMKEWRPLSEFPNS
jgi:GYF domain 2